MIKLLVNLPSTILKLYHASLPAKCCESGSVPQFFLLALFTFGFAVESIKELGGALVEGQENMERNIFVMDTIMDGPLLPINKTH